MLSKKGEATKKKLLQGAIKCLANQGQLSLTFQQIANACGVTQPLVVHYFKKKENILPVVMHEAVEQIRALTDAGLKDIDSPADQLAQYLVVTAKIYRENPALASIFILRYYYSSIDSEVRKIVTKNKNLAVERIKKIVNDGIAQKQFKVESVDLVCRLIHDYQMGVRINYSVVNGTESYQAIVDQLVSHCLLILGYKYNLKRIKKHQA